MSRSYLTYVNGEEARVELLTRNGHQVVARLEREGGEPREITFDVLVRQGRHYHLALPDKRIVDSYVEHSRDNDFEVRLSTGRGEARVPVRAISEREAWIAGGSVGFDESMVVVSMPGRVVKVMVVPGQAVAEGEPILIIEAMKMENEVKAGRAGVVTVVHVEEGQAVESDVVLVEIGDE